MKLGQQQSGGVHIPTGDVGVNIDSSRRDDLAGRIIGGVGARAVQRIRNSAVQHPDVADVVAPTGWINNASAGNARQHARSPAPGKIAAMRVTASATEIASLGSFASTNAKAPVDGRYATPS